MIPLQEQIKTVGDDADLEDLFKDNRPELHYAVWELLGEYQDWITTAESTSGVLAPLDAKPLLARLRRHFLNRHSF